MSDWKSDSSRSVAALESIECMLKKFSECEATRTSRPATKQDLDNLELRVTIALGAVLKMLDVLQQKERQIMKTLDDVLGAVNEESTVEDSVLTLLTSIKAQLDAAAGDQTKIDQIFAGLQANKAKLAAALLANTPQTDSPATEQPAA